MQTSLSLRRSVAACLYLGLYLLGAVALVSTTAAAVVPAQGLAHVAGKSGDALDNAACLQCHDGKKKLELPGATGHKRPLTEVDPAKFGQGVHARLRCIDCHREISDNAAPHKKAGVPKPDCAECHAKLWDTAQKSPGAAASPRLGLIAKNITAYHRSFHAKQNADEPERVNAACHECHDTHSFNMPADRQSAQYANWRLGIPALCGKCHEDQLDEYSESIHGSEILEKKNSKAAVCIDCHTTHEITGTALTGFKLLNPEECGNCHAKSLKTYRDTYHGQVNKLGYTYTAKCYNCHGSHGILMVDDPKSTVHPNNKLKTCRQCHNGKKLPEATAGFVTFYPHADASDYGRYSQVWIASRLMGALLLAVFTFFWLHSGLWYFREWRDRKLRKSAPYVRTEMLGFDSSKHFQRFPLGWRIAHLIFALATMALVLTGTTALFAGSSWAPVVARGLGGPENVALLHRVAVVLFVGIFFLHLVYILQHLLRKPGFKWFGPDSLLPNWKDVQDCIAMFKWFVGRGPKPLFDRWAYFEKFDYWAVFWGVTVIGSSGMLLAFPHVTAQHLPGWIFNVATLVHSEEAFLAAVFLFTVHFFNNHFRPDKLPPPDIVMFTGTLSLAELRRDHPAQYYRLMESGELEKHLVDLPSRPLTLGSNILGLVLISMGLTLLVLVAIGFFAA